MGLSKKAEVVTEQVQQPIAEQESGTTAAIERLKKAAEGTAFQAKEAAPKAQYKQRDFDAEARGKTRCAMYAAALQSPALAGLQFNSVDEFLVLVQKAAESGVIYSFND